MFFVNLNHYELVRISGADTIQFLQGQLSCDLEALSPDQSLRGAICNLKGRVVADFRVIQHGDECLLQCEPGIAAVIEKNLAKYAVFSKVEISTEQVAHSVVGLVGPSSGELLEKILGSKPEQVNTTISTDELTAIKIEGDIERYEVWPQNEAAAAKLQEQLTSITELDIEAWQTQDILAGVIHISTELSEAHTPQLLNYDLSGVISFNKGCYTGQEVVARMYYRGKAKKRMYLLETDAEVKDFTSGNDFEIKSEGKQWKSELLAAGQNYDVETDKKGKTLVLAILPTDVVTVANLYLESGAVKSDLRLLPLSYMEKVENEED